MPRGVRKVGSKWEIYNTQTGKHYGWSATKGKAQASARAAESGGTPRKKERRRKR